jgi:hypothetical protein
MGVNKSPVTVEAGHVLPYRPVPERTRTTGRSPIPVGTPAKAGTLGRTSLAGREVKVWSPTTAGTPTKARTLAATGRQLWQGGTSVTVRHHHRYRHHLKQGH